jgi:hypothetical protein
MTRARLQVRRRNYAIDELKVEEYGALPVNQSINQEQL